MQSPAASLCISSLQLQLHSGREGQRVVPRPRPQILSMRKEAAERVIFPDGNLIAVDDAMDMHASMTSCGLAGTGQKTTTQGRGHRVCFGFSVWKPMGCEAQSSWLRPQLCRVPLALDR